jgi:hypothetical protein
MFSKQRPRASVQTWADIDGIAAPAHDRQMIAPAQPITTLGVLIAVGSGTSFPAAAQTYNGYIWGAGHAQGVKRAPAVERAARGRA